MAESRSPNARSHDPQAVVLAAGRGTRMRSRRAKMLHPLGGRALVLHILEAVRSVTLTPVVVIGAGQDEVRRTVEPLCTVVHQAEPRGTGDALRSLPSELRSAGPVLVCNGDLPLLRKETLEDLVRRHRESRAAVTLLTVVLEDAAGYGRIVRAAGGAVARIVEERDMPPGEDPPRECNVGVYVFDGSALWPALDALRSDNAQGEFYLTDVIALIDGRIEAVLLEDRSEALQVNDRVQLAVAAAALRWRVLEDLMLAGVTVDDPATTYVEATVRVGRDTVLRPMTSLLGDTVLGEECVIGPMAQLRDVSAGDRITIAASALEECRLGHDVAIGQYCRVRPQSVLGDGVRLGTHAEIKNSTLGAGSQVNHFSCVLDSDVGERVNIGAGAVTCNFDGVAKYRTVIDDDAFVGTNSSLVAPLHVGAGAFIAAGSVVSHDVPAGALAVERAGQRTLPGWVERRRTGMRCDQSPR